MTGIIIKRGNFDIEVHTQGEQQVKMRAEIVVMQQEPRNTRLPGGIET